MQQAASHFLNQRLAICFLTWRAALEKALLGAAKLDHAVGHWLHGTQAKVFAVWRDQARFKAKSRPILAGMLSCLSRTHLHNTSSAKHFKISQCLRACLHASISRIPIFFRTV